MQKKFYIKIISILLILPLSGKVVAESKIIDPRREIEVHVTEAQMRLSFFISNLEPGSVLQFGNYELDNNLSNGKEPIDWIILSKNENNKTAILITLNIIDCLRFNGFHENVTWETSSLRAYMNTQMLVDMFTNDEINCIKTSHLENMPNPYYQVSSGNDTDDKIYIPSIQDIYKYFGNPNFVNEAKWAELMRPNLVRAAKATPYAISRGVRTLSHSKLVPSNGNYFLRTIGLPGSRIWYNDVVAEYYQSYVTEFGEVKPDGTGINSNDDGIRVMTQVYY